MFNKVNLQELLIHYCVIIIPVFNSSIVMNTLACTGNARNKVTQYKKLVFHHCDMTFLCNQRRLYTVGYYIAKIGLAG
jgi:hypothetical protein